MAKALESNKVLEDFSLNGNDIGNEGMRVLAIGLTGCKGSAINTVRHTHSPVFPG
jgi:hypothetical protein